MDNATKASVARGRFQCCTTTRSSANSWAAIAALHRDTPAARVRTMSDPRVSRQGLSNRATRIRGDLRTGAWASGHVVQRLTGGLDIEKSLNHAARILAFEPALGPFAICVWVRAEQANMCDPFGHAVHVSMEGAQPRASHALAQQQCGSCSSQTLCRISQHATRELCEIRLVQSIWIRPATERKFPWKMVFNRLPRWIPFGCTSPCSHAVPLRAMTMMKHMVFIAMRKSSLSEIASRVGLIGDIKKSLKSIGDLLRWHGSSLCVGGLQRVRSLRAAIYPAHTLVTQNSIVASSRRRARGGRVSQRRRIAALRSVRVGPSRGLGVR
jgi:hypothetical protein